MLATKSYLAVNKLQWRAVESTLEKYLPLMKKRRGRGDVMDIGCGPGDITTELLLPKLENLQRLVAVDINDVTIDFAKRNFAHEKVEYAVVDISKDMGSEFEGKFDQIYSFFCLNWVKDLSKALQNINKCLRPGGTVLLSFVTDCPQIRAYDVMSRDKKWSKYAINFKGFTMNYHDRDDPIEDFTRLLKKANFEILKCDLVRHSQVYDNEEGIRDFCRAINDVAAAVPEELEDKYWDEVMDYIRNHDKFPPMCQDGRYYYHFNFLNVVASKL